MKGALSVIALDMSADAMIGYCEQAAPATAPALRGQWRQWRQVAQLPQIENGLGGESLGKARTSLQSVADAAVDKLKGMGAAATNCPQISGWLREGPFDTRRAYPALYAMLGKGAPAGIASSTTAPGGAVGAGATFYTPAQLTALVDGWWGNPRSLDRARRAMAAGPIIVQGKVVRHGTLHFLETNDGVFRSRWVVSTGLGEKVLAPMEGRTLTVQGRLHELPMSMVFLRDTRIVDAAGLRPSPLPAEPGLTRMNVGADQVAAAAGSGLKPAQIHGLLYHGYGATGVNGYEFREEVLLFLKDGTYYRGKNAPEGLDVAKSRRLEPQLWGHWRAVGGGFEIQANDDHGQPSGAWRGQAGHIVPAWKPGQTLAGTYTNKAFYGSVALGGVFHSNSYRFSPDGRFEAVGYAQGGSGTMAATASGFVGSGSAYSDGRGTQRVAGGGGPGVFAGSKSTSDDGASHRGTYKLSGYSLTLRFDDGHSETLLCAPWSNDLKDIYMLGRTFTRQ